MSAERASFVPDLGPWSLLLWQNISILEHFGANYFQYALALRIIHIFGAKYIYFCNFWSKIFKDGTD